MVDTLVGDLYVWCRPAFENVVFDLLAWVYPGLHVQASRVLGLTMFRIPTSVPQDRPLALLNEMVTYGAGAIVYMWFESVPQA